MRISDWSSDGCSSDLWNLDPVLLAAFVFGIAFYFLRSRQPENRQRYFGIGIAVLAFLFISPFCALTSALFSARTAHHIRSEEHTSELQSLMRTSYAVFCLKKKNKKTKTDKATH